MQKLQSTLSIVDSYWEVGLGHEDVTAPPFFVSIPVAVKQLREYLRLNLRLPGLFESLLITRLLLLRVNIFARLPVAFRIYVRHEKNLFAVGRPELATRCCGDRS